MAKKSEEITLNLVIKESKTFVNFLKKFTGIDQSALLEIINNGDEKLIAIKIATPSNTSIKVGTLPFTEVFKDCENLPKSIKIGMFAFEKFITILSLSGDSDVNFNLTYDINEKKECIAKSIIMINKSDEFELFIVCAPQTIFASLAQDLEVKVFNKENVAYTFTMSKEFFGRFKRYIKLDSNDLFTLKINKGKLFFVGKTQKLPFPDSVDISDDEVVANIKKEYLNFLDDEVYQVSVKLYSVIFESVESNIKLALSSSLTADNDDDENEKNDDDSFMDDDMEDTDIEEVDTEDEFEDDEDF